jgi:hypothetical protein
MSTKINKLLTKWPKGAIGTSSWMEASGIGPDLRKAYKESGWIKAIASGAYTRFDDTADWQGALFAMQTQLQLPIHAAALTAIELKGRAHFIPQADKHPIYLFARREATIPKWKDALPDSERLQVVKTEIFANVDDAGLSKFSCGNFSITISALERAMMEFLYLVPKVHSTDHARKIMESLTTLRPLLVQELLENCKSVKVKRLFLALAEESDHRWLVQIDKEKLDLGSGKRTIDPGGTYNSTYQITIAARELD